MAIKNIKEFRRNRIKLRVRKDISGTASRPRLSVFRSNKQIYAQLIDDVAGVTLAAASSSEKAFADFKGTKLEQAAQVGKLIAERAEGKNVVDVVFDRNGYLYHGRIKSLAEAAREGGLKF
ncbi:MAG: 50S ribosomal protein L18 [Bacteroidales bacterium]